MWKEFSEQHGTYPSGVPRLYPEQPTEQLVNFLSEEDAERIRGFRRVAVVPFASERGDETEEEIGHGMARLLARDLSLLKTHSVLGPEDTPDEAFWYRKDVEGLMREQKLDACFMGRLGRTEEGLVFRLRLRARDSTAVTEEVEGTEIEPFLQQITRLAVGMLGTTLSDVDPQALQSGRPASFNSLRTYGQLLKAEAKYDPDRESAEERLPEIKSLLRKLHQSDPAFVLPVLSCPASLRATSSGEKLLKSAFQHDPYDAQLCFYLFLRLWEGSQDQPEAAQFLRRAIELSPGHGKSHMCMPHAVPWQPELLRHSELGYRLLPTNNFAIGNYLRNLRRSGTASNAELITLAKEGIDADRYDPSNYEQIIDLLKQEERYKDALTFAEKLQKLISPPLNSRTKYCMGQAQGESPLFSRDPQKELQKMIKWLRARS